MSFTLKDIVPWGRSFDEYVAMFSLSESDLKKPILGCGDGPASFNAELTRRQGRVVSVDPLYGYSATAIRRSIDETFDEVLEQTRSNRQEFVWTNIETVEELGRLRMAAMEDFLADFEPGLRLGRYRQGALPGLAFADGQFAIALCSHLLFLYSAQLSEEFHLASIRELCRVADEARIIPLLELGARTSRHLQPVMAKLTTEGYEVELIPVAYEFQRGGNRMMRVVKQRRQT